MVYAILGIIFVVALFLIFRDDHDDSYVKNEKGRQKAPKTQYQKTEVSGPKAAAEPKASESKASEPKAEKPRSEGADAKEKMRNMMESIFREVKEQTAEPLKEIQKDVQHAMDEAKAAIDKAMREAGQKPFGNTDMEVDEQEQPLDEEELDLSFLDSLDYYPDLEESSDTFDITGLRYHCSVYDCGKIVGVVQPEPSNSHDSRAQAVIRADGKFLGYIPRTQLGWYEDFNPENVVCPFVGEIELDESTQSLIAAIKVIIPSSLEFVQEEIEDEL